MSKDSVNLNISYMPLQVAMPLERTVLQKSGTSLGMILGIGVVAVAALSYFGLIPHFQLSATYALAAGGGGATLFLGSAILLSIKHYATMPDEIQRQAEGGSLKPYYKAKGLLKVKHHKKTVWDLAFEAKNTKVLKELIGNTKISRSKMIKAFHRFPELREVILNNTPKIDWYELSKDAKLPEKLDILEALYTFAPEKISAGAAFRFFESTFPNFYTHQEQIFRVGTLIVEKKKLSQEHLKYIFLSFSSQRLNNSAIPLYQATLAKLKCDLGNVNISTRRFILVKLSKCVDRASLQSFIDKNPTIFDGITKKEQLLAELGLGKKSWRLITRSLIDRGVIHLNRPRQRKQVVEGESVDFNVPNDIYINSKQREVFHRSLRIANHLRQTHYVFGHAQTFGYSILTDLYTQTEVSSISRAFHPLSARYRRRFRLQEAPYSSMADFDAENKRIYLDDRLLCAGGDLRSGAEAASHLYYFSNNMNVTGFKRGRYEIAIAQLVQNAAFRKAFTAELWHIQSTYRSNRFYLIGVPKARVKDLVAPSHQGTKRCDNPQKWERLEREQDLSQPAPGHRCCGGSATQYRILISALDRDPDAQVHAFDTTPNQSDYQEYMHQLTAWVRATQRLEAINEKTPAELVVDAFRRLPLGEHVGKKLKQKTQFIGALREVLLSNKQELMKFSIDLTAANDELPKQVTDLLIELNIITIVKSESQLKCKKES